MFLGLGFLFCGFIGAIAFHGVKVAQMVAQEQEATVSSDVNYW